MIVALPGLFFYFLLYCMCSDARAEKDGLAACELDY